MWPSHLAASLWAGPAEVRPGADLDEAVSQGTCVLTWLSDSALQAGSKPLCGPGEGAASRAPACVLQPQATPAPFQAVVVGLGQAAREPPALPHPVPTPLHRGPRAGLPACDPAQRLFHTSVPSRNSVLMWFAWN